MKAIAQSYQEYATYPDRYLTIAGVLPELAVRLPGFSDFGMNGDKLVKAIQQAGSQMGPATPAWSDVLINYGHEAMQIDAFLEASFWYFFARFPHIFHDKAAKAYELHNEAYVKALGQSAYEYELFPIPVQGRKGYGILRYPKNLNKKFQVVMLSGGIDVWKSDLEVHYLSEVLLQQGLAVLLLDVPGTGQCPIPASLSAHQWYQEAMKQLTFHPRINGEKIAFYGLSFGGYWATKLAFLEPTLSGVINNGGPVHLTFHKPHFNQLPFGLKKVLAKMLGDEKQPADVLDNKMTQFSLFQQGILSKKSAPILHINGAKDEVVTIKEIDFLTQQGIKQDTLIFSEDRHVASRHWHVHAACSAAWLLKKLG